MKTPKEIILESHRAAEPRLDRLREAVLAAELGRPASRPNFAAALAQKLWLELIWPSRRAWAGLAAVWVVLAVVHFATQRPIDSTLYPVNPQLMTSWVQEQQLLAQLLDHPRPAPAKDPAPARPDQGDGPPAKSAQWLAEEFPQLC